MTKNIHPWERGVRVVAGAFLMSLAFWGPKSYWFLIGVVPLLTGLLGWCPPYALFGINTCRLGSGKNVAK
ncbi:MAG: DUF2892 domain-containing protein [Elusimicrobia bacterium]|nr:DUF2892 domain-containing protein [Elusimicrobiota bacterium]